MMIKFVGFMVEYSLMVVVILLWDLEVITMIESMRIF